MLLLFFFLKKKFIVKILVILAIKEIKEDKNFEFKFCLEHLFISATRAGSKLHKTCENVYTAKHIKGKNTLEIVNFYRKKGQRNRGK